MSNKFSIVSVGFNNEINFQRVLGVFCPSSVAGRKLMSESKNDGTVLDVTMGRKARSVILFDNKTVLLSALNPQTIKQRGDIAEEEEDE